MTYKKGFPIQGDCLTHLKEQGIEIIYHTTKPETITILDGTIWHKPFGHKPDGFSNIKIK